MFRFDRLLGLIAVLIVVGATFAAAVRTPHYEPDAFLYLRMMLVDRGETETQAYADASRYFLAGPAAHDPDAPGYYGAHPPRFFVAQYPLFRSRPLVPWIGARLFPLLGYHALDIIAAAGVVVGALITYLIVLMVAPAWLAACAAVAAVATPLMRDVGVTGATDGPAFALWTACLGATLAYARRPSRTMLAIAVGANLVLGATRPAVWLPIGAAAGMLVFAYRNGEGARKAAARTLFLAQMLVAVAVVIYTKAVGGPGFFDLLKWQYDWHADRHQHWIQYGIFGWWLLFTLRDFVIEPIWLMAAGTPVFALPLAWLGFAGRRGDPIVAVCAGTALASLVAIPLNPPDFARPIEVPLAPIVVLGIAALAAQRVRARGQSVTIAADSGASEVTAPAATVAAAPV